MLDGSFKELLLISNELFAKLYIIYNHVIRMNINWFKYKINCFKEKGKRCSLDYAYIDEILDIMLTKPYTKVEVSLKNKCKQ